MVPSPSEQVFFCAKWTLHYAALAHLGPPTAARASAARGGAAGAGPRGWVPRRPRVCPTPELLLVTASDNDKILGAIGGIC